MQEMISTLFNASMALAVLDAKWTQRSCVLAGNCPSRAATRVKNSEAVAALTATNDELDRLDSLQADQDRSNSEAASWHKAALSMKESATAAAQATEHRAAASAPPKGGNTLLQLDSASLQGAAGDEHKDESSAHTARFVNV